MWNCSCVHSVLKHNGEGATEEEFSLENFNAIQSKQIFCNETRLYSIEWPFPAVVQYFIKSAT